MKSDFDKAANSYDEEFTYSSIGTIQRNQVWKYLNEEVVDKQSIKILELNCGTGEDAVRFAQKGHEVVATDISENMLKVANEKSDNLQISYRVLDLNKIEEFEGGKDFDLVFSNFGGLNCVSSDAIRKLGEVVSKMLKPNGRFVAVVMPEFCLWETVYFLLKGRWKEAFRRAKEYAMANVSGEQVKTYYFSPGKFKKLNADHFTTEILKPIGLHIPPSYLENFLKRRPALLNLLDKLDTVFARYSWQAYLSDHYYIQFSKK